MIYKIREKFWTWGNCFDITDHHDVPVYYVEGKVFSWGDKLSFQDAGRRELAFIDQKLWSWLPRYRILADGAIHAEVLKEWAWLKPKFAIRAPGPDSYRIDGSLWQHEFEITRNGQPAARISKKIWSWTDTYGVDIADGENDVLLLCSCIVIDQVLFNKRKRSNS